MDWKQGRNTWLFQSADLTVLDFLLHCTKQGGLQSKQQQPSEVKNWTCGWVQLQLSSLGHVKNVIILCRCAITKEPIYTSPTTYIIPTDRPSFYILFHAPSIHYQQTTKIKESGN
jgi:hypothetical protein